MKRLALAYGGLVAIGAVWGISAPAIRYATEAGFGPVTILLWQVLFDTVVLGVGLAIGGKLRSMPLDAAHLRLYAVVGLFGMALPALASITATSHLPAGIISIVISLVPLFALPIALALRTERFAARRLGGVALGAAAMALLVAPAASLPAGTSWIWVPVAALAPFCYAIEGAFVFGSPARGASPLQTLWAGYVVGLVFVVPLALATGAEIMPSGASPWAGAAFLAAGVLGIFAYAGYLALVRATGSVFGAQVSYTVTGMGILWSMLLLGERYPLTVWAALALLFAGLFLVQPRGAFAAIAEDVPMGPADDNH